jgi:hypothetical protein
LLNLFRRGQFLHVPNHVLLAPCALAPHPSGFARARVYRRLVEPIIPCSTPTSPARSKNDLVVVPRIIKKSQASGEDEASSVVFTKCATKSSNKSSIVILVYAKICED